MVVEEIKDRTVAQIVTQDIAFAHVFKKYGIDFCCGGGITIEKACEINSVSIQELTHDLTEWSQHHSPEKDYNSWPLSRLIDHIITTHHHYIKETIPLLKFYAAKVAKVHGNNYPQLLEIDLLVSKTSDELLSHLKKEEQILFPYIQHLLECEHSEAKATGSCFGTIQNPILAMMAEHDDAGETFKVLADLTDNYTPPPKACNTFKALYHLLGDFERDLHVHVHLENNILFPKTMELERKRRL